MSENKKISRKEQRRLEAEKEATRKRLFTWVPIISVVVLLVAIILWRNFQPPIDGVIETPNIAGGNHVSEPTYADTGLPPVGGAHAPSWANCGIYEIEVPSKFAVHSMEHGAVWITYQPDLDLTEIAELQTLVSDETSGFVLLSPFPGQTEKIVATAWGYQLTTDSTSDARLKSFIKRYQLSPTSPEAGASCFNGVGNPIK